MNMKALKLAIIFSVFSLLQACATDPVTGRPSFALSESWEINAGQKYHEEILKQYSVYDDPELQAYVNDIGQRLAKKSHRPDLAFTFTLLDSPEVNAFALPGGYVYITRGIMAYMGKESHLAGVIGHEIGHVTGRHGAERAAQQQIASGVSLVVAVGTGSNELAQVSQLFGGALMSGYGRRQELESDRLGAEYIAHNNYAPDDMIDVIGILKNQELFARERAAAEGKEYQGYHSLFSTHPKNDTRLQGVIKAAEKFRDTTKPIPDDGRFLRLTDGMAYGDSEAQGIVNGNRFYHKGLNLFVEFPEGWRVQNTPAILGAVSPQGDQVVTMQMDSLVPPLDAQGYLSSKFQNFHDARRVTTDEDTGLSGLATISNEQGQQSNVRVGMITRGNQAFVLTAQGNNFVPDQSFFNVAQSIRRLKPEERKFATGGRIKLIKARQGDTVRSLAQRSNLNDYAESQIRLINNLYPDGEPVAGQMIKIIE